MSEKDVEFIPVPVIQDRTQYVDRHVTIHEHRAPTDKSVELLKEMQEKAIQNLIASIPLKSNLFEGHITVMRDAMNNGDIFIATAIINGKSIEARGQFNRYDEPTPHERLKKMRDALAEKIATEILLEPFIKAQQNFRA